VPCIQATLDVPIVNDIVTGLGPLLIVHGNPEPGKIAVSCSPKQSGWAIRSCADNADMGTVSLLNTNRRYADPIKVMCYQHYEHFAQSKEAARDALYEFLLKGGFNIKAKSGYLDKIDVDVSYLRRHMAEYLDILRMFI
jgi:hypothetical protein